MELIVLGLNHRSAPLEVRERLDFSKLAREIYLPKLAARRSVRSGMVLSTCNRVEVYASGKDPGGLVEDAQEFLREFHGLDEGDLRSFFYSKANREAVRHLFRVTSSLDSMVVGEPQILGQVKEAYFAASAASLVDPFFDRLLRKAFSVAKRVRSETGVAEQAVSISYAAVELATKIFGDLKGKQVMVLGAGQMAELAAKHFQRQKAARILFSGRSFEHAVELAREYSGVPIPYERFPEYLHEVDVVLVSTAAPHFIVGPGHVSAAMEERKQAPMFFIDISVPRNVDPAIDRIEDVYLYNIDDLQGIVQSNVRSREFEAEKARAIVDSEVERFYESVEKLSAGPVVAALRRKAEAIRKRELERLRKKLPGLTEKEFLEIERGVDSLVGKMLHDPTVFLKGETEGLRSLDRAAFVRDLFGLDDEEGPAE